MYNVQLFATGSFKSLHYKFIVYNRWHICQYIDSVMPFITFSTFLPFFATWMIKFVGKKWKNMILQHTIQLVFYLKFVTF